MSLPYLDEHAISIAAPRRAVDEALERYTAGMCRGERPLLSRLLGLQPRSGFTTAAPAPGEQVRLRGRHRFATYALAFTTNEDGDGATLRAVTYARFPGVRGGAYRALLIGTGGHAFATRRILRSIKQIAER
jgi:hypothetical protein